MTLDLLHNKIVKETVSERFSECVKNELCPKLEGIYGDALLGIQMYEDYINDDFSKDGFWYYPLTVILESGVETLWIKWELSAKNFKDGVPYAFVGDTLEFLLADDVPAEFLGALEGRSTYFEGGYVKVNVHTNAPIPTFLSGKYSQTFIDEMTRQLSSAICRACGVTGIENSTVEVDVVFTPETYMEHTSENVTYRRLLMSAKGCAARDFWIKWTRLNSSVAYSVKDSVCADDIVFEIGEDVSHKIREKEYRFLVYGNSDKYRIAMGRKNITEWRELIKRAVKRGELNKTFTEIEVSDHASEVSDKLSEILEKCGVNSTRAFNEEPETASVAAANEALLSALGLSGVGGTEAEETEETATEEFSIPTELVLTLEDIVEETEPVYATDSTPASDLDLPINDAPIFDNAANVSDRNDELEVEAEAMRLEIENARRRLEEERLAMENAKRALAEEKAAMEAERSRLLNEERARKLAEAEAERLRMEQESLIRENRRLAEKTRLAEEIREREETARREQETRLREQLELEAREKAREKMLFAEAARLAREEHERLAAERAEADALKAAEEARIEALRREEENRLLEEERIRAERERIENEARVRVMENERRRAEVEARAAEARAYMEREARLSADSRAASSNEYTRVTPMTAPPIEQAPTAAVSVTPEYTQSAPVSTVEYTYTSKLVRLMFRRNIDPNITSRIHEMISIALSHYGKEDVYIKVKASIPDSSTVILNFVKIPEEELDLLVDIIKFLGNSDLGIYKVILE